MLHEMQIFCQAVFYIIHVWLLFLVLSLNCNVQMDLFSPKQQNSLFRDTTCFMKIECWLWLLHDKSDIVLPFNYFTWQTPIATTAYTAVVKPENGRLWEIAQKKYIKMLEMGLGFIKTLRVDMDLLRLSKSLSAVVFITQEMCLATLCMSFQYLFCDMCDCLYHSWHSQCVLSRRFITPEFWGLSRKEESPSNWKWGHASLKLTALRYANFLFIYFLLNDLICKPRWNFFFKY